MAETDLEQGGDILAAVDITLAHIARIESMDGDVWFAAWAEAQIEYHQGLLQLFLTKMRANRFYSPNTLAQVEAMIAAGLGGHLN